VTIHTSYSVRIGTSLHAVLSDTLAVYRSAVDFYIDVMLHTSELFSECNNNLAAVRAYERITVLSPRHYNVQFSFCDSFPKFPSYLRRAVIAEAFGLVSSYRSNYGNWEVTGKKGEKPSVPQAGFVSPAMYRDNCFVRTGTYTARIKVWIRNTWDWVNVTFRKCDVDYLLRRCSGRKECVPTLRNKGKVWSLDFSFEENVKLNDTKIANQRIVAVDLGINNACTCSVMNPDGTVVGRRFLRLPSEYDCLNHRIGKIKQAHQRGARRTPRLWSYAKGINVRIAVLTAQFVTDTAVMYDADCIVMEALDVKGRKRGSKKQKLHLWRCQYVQEMVENKAHRFGIRISRICAWGTSRLAFDGSGPVKRGNESERTNGNYSLCEFSTGKLYHCDLNASYNIGARYFIRELLKSVTATRRLQLEAEVPSVCRRSTCTLSDLISLYAVLAA